MKERICGNCKYLGDSIKHSGYFECNRIEDTDRYTKNDMAVIRGSADSGAYLAVLLFFGCALFEEKPDNED